MDLLFKLFDLISYIINIYFSPHHSIWFLYLFYLHTLIMASKLFLSSTNSNIGFRFSFSNHLWKVLNKDQCSKSFSFSYYSFYFSYCLITLHRYWWSPQNLVFTSLIDSLNKTIHFQITKKWFSIIFVPFKRIISKLVYLTVNILILGHN